MVPNKLKGYRVMAGYTQEELAKAIGISKKSFVDKELGKKEFTLSEAQMIFNVLSKKLSIKFDDIFLN